MDQIERTRVAQRRAEAALAKLVDQAVGLGIGWPEIATRLGVTRQAARQHYQRRHRGSMDAQYRRSWPAARTVGVKDQVALTTSVADS